MSDSSYITKLREARTLVASKRQPPIVNNTVIHNSFSLPNGFNIYPTSDNTVNVDINGNLAVNGTINPKYLQLEPQLELQLNKNVFLNGGSIWVKTYADELNNKQFSLNFDNKVIFDTTNLHLKSIEQFSFKSLLSNTINVDYISTTSANLTSNIIVNANLLPSINNNFSLGSHQNQWSSIWAKELNINNNTINIFDNDGKKMSISYDVNKGASFITTDDEITVETVTTSKFIPGVIDPSLLPFSGLSFASKINITEYKKTVGNSLLTQLLHSVYTLNREVLTNYFESPDFIVEHYINKIIGQLNGIYYVVINSNKNVEQVLLPKIRASTNFNETNKSNLNITSLFRVESEELIEISDGDILIIYYSYIPNGDKFDIIFGFQNINFRLPFNSVNNNNIVDNTITSNKLKDLTISNNKIGDGSVSLRTLSDEVIKYINRGDGNEISSIVCLCDKLENKINKIEKYIKLLSNTYYIEDISSNKSITFDNIDEFNIL